MTNQLPPENETEAIEIDGLTIYLRSSFSERHDEWVYELWTAAGEHLEPETPFIGRPSLEDIRVRLVSASSIVNEKHHA